MKYGRIEYGIFISRPNRFIAYVDINGKTETVHVKNTGRCKELLLPGVKVILERSDNPARKTAYDLIAVYKKKFGLVDNGVSENTIIIDTKNVKLALEVDEVVEIGDIEPENIVPMPEIALNAQTQYMPRVAHVDGNLIILLDVTELLSEEEEAVVKQMAEDMK